MKVKITNNYSGTQTIPSSIPQWLIIGLLLFLIFMNDLLDDIKSKIKLFTDKVKLFVRL